MLKKYWNDLLSLIYPNVCYNCNVPLVDGEEKICLRCYKDFPLTEYHLAEPNPLLQMTSGVPKVQGAYGYMKFNKHGIAQKLLHELKYKGNAAIGIALGGWFAHYITKELSDSEIDCIIPLPLHKSKKRKRGFNQSEIIARGMSKSSGIAVVDDVLIRTKNITTQTKKGKVERWQNVERIYEVVNSEKIKGKRVMLLDDVITTGATIGAAAETLAETEVDKIYLGCIASGK